MKKQKFHSNIFKNLVENHQKREAICPHFLKCGGCSFQDFEYENQAKVKKEETLKLFDEIFEKENLENVGAYCNTLLQDVKIFCSPNEFSYRTRMDFVVSEGKFGLRKKRSFNQIEELTECHILNFEVFQIIKRVFEKSQSLGISCNNLVTHEGFLRYISVRTNLENEIMIILVTKSGNEFDKEVEELADWSLNVLNCEIPQQVRDDNKNVFPQTHDDNGKMPKVVSVYQLLNDGLADLSFGEIKKFWGEQYLKFQILAFKNKILHTPNPSQEGNKAPFLLREFTSLNEGNFIFQIGPNTFFQQNILLFEKLLARILENIPENKKVLDLYCGVGTLTLPISCISEKIVGVESVSESIELAKENAKLNKIENARFVCSEVDKFLESEDFQNERFDILILDPPRVGLEKSAEKILEMGFEKIIYLSCNPFSQAKDLEILLQKYKLIDLSFWDLYPQTPHLESLAILERI